MDNKRVRKFLKELKGIADFGDLVIDLALGVFLMFVFSFMCQSLLSIDLIKKLTSVHPLLIAVPEFVIGLAIISLILYALIRGMAIWAKVMILGFDFVPSLRLTRMLKQNLKPNQREFKEEDTRGLSSRDYDLQDLSKAAAKSFVAVSPNKVMIAVRLPKNAKIRSDYITDKSLNSVVGDLLSSSILSDKFVSNGGWLKPNKLSFNRGYWVKILNNKDRVRMR